MSKKDRVIKEASKVSNFLLALYEVYPERFPDEIPHGDLAYGEALVHWQDSGCSSQSFFSYAEGQRPCKVLLEFRKELTEKFGLQILTAAEAKLRTPLQKKKVTDWGLN